MDKHVRSALERELAHRREILQENRAELGRAKARVSTLESYVVEEAEAVSALERELYADRSYAEAVCIVAGCGLPRYIHGGPGRPTSSSHRFQAADDA